MTMTPVAMTAEQLADQLGVRPSTLAEWRNTGYGPPYRAVGRRVIYLSTTVAAWIESQPDRTVQKGKRGSFVRKSDRPPA